METKFQSQKDNDVEQLLTEIETAILCWYPFEYNKQILVVEDDNHNISNMLSEKDANVCVADINTICSEEFIEVHKKKFGYIIAIQQLEKSKEPLQFLQICKKVLDDSGIFLLGVDNRLALRFFCGDKDPFTNNILDSIENYRMVDKLDRKVMKGRLYSKAEIENMFVQSGWQKYQFYSVLSGLKSAQFIYSSDFLPREDMGIRVLPYYHCPDTIFTEEEQLYNSLIENGMFHQMANAYLIECYFDDSKAAKINQVSLSLDRGHEIAMATILHKNYLVEKKPLFDEGKTGIIKLDTNMKKLKDRGVLVVDGHIEEDSYIMPYIDAPLGNVYLRELLKQDKNQFIEAMDLLKDTILKSSDTILQEIDGCKELCMIDGYIDMVPLNAFYVDGQYMFFDQEFTIKNLPFRTIMTRAIEVVYSVDMELDSILPRTFLFERYKIADRLELSRKQIDKFMEELLNKRELKMYHEHHWHDIDVVYENRHRMNYPEFEYRRLFVDIFDDLEDKQIYLFGAGIYTKKFLGLYKKRYHIAGIIDNNESHWGDKLDDITIYSPAILTSLNRKDVKIIICIKRYSGVMSQLDELGLKNYVVYDAHMIYPKKDTISDRNKKEIIDKEKLHNKKDDNIPKQYKVGYIAGVFDLFHIGHLNMFKRAKEKCEYLIVGVVTDEGVRAHKKTEPFVPFEERLELVKSCRYVDEAVEIPFSYGGVRDAYRLHQFDVEFSGSDYINNPDWIAEKEFLEKHGATLEFFSYTESTSSTKLKSLIESRQI